MNSATRYVFLGIKVLLSLAFLGAGLSKLAGVEMMVETFGVIGLGQWFRYLTGLIEVGSVVLLWVPGFQAIGAGLLVCTMIGAVLAHLLILGPSAMPAIVLGVLAGAILYQNRAQLTR